MQKRQIFLDETVEEPREVRLLKKTRRWCNLLMLFFIGCFMGTAVLFGMKKLNEYNGIMLLIIFTILVVLSLTTKWLTNTRLSTIKNTGW